MKMHSKLPDVGTTIFTVMSQLAAEHNAINLSQGFPNFDCDQRLKDLVVKHLSAGRNQYAPMPGIASLRAAIATKIEGLYDVKPDPDTEITVTAGATQAIYTAIGSVIRPDDEVIIFDPAYDCYGPSVTSYGGKPIPVALAAPDFFIDWELVESLVSPLTRMIIVNSPHNPLGRMLRTSDLDALEAIAIKYDLFVLSDEVYEHLTFDSLPHLTVLSRPGLRDRSFAVYSFGKVFHTTGWKVGYCVAPQHMTTEFRKIHQFNMFSVNTPMQYALAEYLEDESKYLELPSFFQAKRDLFVELMEGTPFEMLLCEGSYFALADYSGISDSGDMEFAHWLTIEHGVAVIPLSPFYSDMPPQHVVRFCFAKTNELLEEAASRLRSVVS